MEASESPGLPRAGNGRPLLQRPDLESVGETLAHEVYASGFARLELMVNTVLERLLEPGKGTAD
jgi:hypothetical protein